MARGNQREQDRAKAQKKLAEKNKGSQREGKPADRNASDKEALAAKVAAKKEKEAAAAAAAAADEGKTKVVRKAKPKKDAGLDDLLNAGLGATKKKGKN